MNLVGLTINLLFSHNFKQFLKNLESEALMYQRNGRIGISKQRVRHLSFYCIAIFFHITILSLCRYLMLFSNIQI